MCKGCEYYNSIVDDMPDELTTGEVVCLVGHILDTYLSDYSLSDKAEICKAITWDYLGVRVSLEPLN